MMEQLGITRLRPGPSGNANATNAANYDPAKANPFPDLPDPLVTKNGQTVTNPEQWWKVRRPEIVEDFEREVFGRVPKSVPRVTWTVVTQATDRVVGTLPVAAKQLVGNVDNTACPSIKVGIEGVSRYGKAALVTLAFEPRFAVALVGSSGEGGAKLHRRNFGEAVENLTGSGESHWMAGNFLKYGAAESRAGSKNAGDLPVDAHELIALCAPRPTFISYGIPARGDAHWLDQQGRYMATVAAGPVFHLLGAKDIGEKENYRTAKMPAVNTGLLDGELAWRQHDGGHEDRSNMKHFIAWASNLLKHTPPTANQPKQE